MWRDLWATMYVPLQRAHRSLRMAAPTATAIVRRLRGKRDSHCATDLSRDLHAPEELARFDDTPDDCDDTQELEDQANEAHTGSAAP